MKKNSFINVSLLLIAVLLIASCKKKNFNDDIVTPPVTQHAITSITPSSAVAGTTVTIKGTQFGTISTVLTVKINNTVLNFNLVDSNTITVVIPQGLGSGPVVIIKNNSTVTGPNFEYLNPVVNPTITALTPAAAQYGNTVTIKGTSFGTVASNLIVKINNTNLTFNLVDSNTITVIIPRAIGSGAVSITKNSIMATGPNFEYLYTGNVTTFSGNGDITPLEGTALNVGYDQPFGIALDAQNNLYVGDGRGLKKIDGNGNVAYFNATAYGNGTGPLGDIVVIAPKIFFTGTQKHTIFSYNTTIDPTTGTGTIKQEAANFSAGFLDGTALADVKFDGPYGIAKNSANELLIADANNNCVRKLIPQISVTTYAGAKTPGDVNANGTAARFKQPFGITIDASNEILLCDVGNSKIKKITATKDVTTVAGTTSGYADGTVANAKFSEPTSAVKDDAGNILITDFNNTVRCVSASGLVYTVAGVNSPNAGAFANGIGAAAKFNGPVKIIFAGSKTFYISDANNRRIRKMILE
jgi:hypothetical protein